MIATLRVADRYRGTSGVCHVDLDDGTRTTYMLTAGPDRICGVLVERLQSLPLRIGPIAEHVAELARNEIHRGRGVTRYELHVADGVVTHTAVAVAA